MSAEAVGFVGLGHMGAPMAAHVAGAGRELVAFDIAGTQARAPAGAVCAGSTEQVAAAAGVIFLSLPDVAAGREVVGRIAGAAAPGALVVDTATVGPAAAREAHALLAARGIGYVDAPVSGMAARAREGTLISMYSGSAADLERVRPLVSRYSARLVHVGTAPGQGQTMKLVNNFLAISHFVTTSEAIATGLRGGLDMGVMLEVIEGATGQNFVASHVFPRHMATETYDSGGAATLPRKDLSLFVAAAGEMGAPRHVARATLEVLDAFADSEPESDQSAIYRFIRDGGEPG